MQAYLVPCWWVNWWLWRAGCISQDTYLLYLRHWPERKDWDSMARGCKRSLSDFSHLHQPLEPQGVFLARWGWSKVPLEKFLLLGFTQQTSRNSLTWPWLFIIIYPKENSCWRKAGQEQPECNLSHRAISSVGRPRCFPFVTILLLVSDSSSPSRPTPLFHIQL